MWRKPPYRWRPASSPWIGAKGQAPATVVVRTPPSPVVVTEKNSGALIVAVLGVGAVAFGIMELMGVTHVFTTPTIPPAPKPPGAAPVPGAAPTAVPAPGTAPTGTPPATPAMTK